MNNKIKEAIKKWRDAISGAKKTEEIGIVEIKIGNNSYFKLYISRVPCYIYGYQSPYFHCLEEAVKFLQGKIIVNTYDIKGNFINEIKNNK